MKHSPITEISQEELDILEVIEVIEEVSGYSQEDLQYRLFGDPVKPTKQGETVWH